MLDLKVTKRSHAQSAWSKLQKILYLIATQYQLLASIVDSSLDSQSRVLSTNEKWNALFASANSNLETLKHASGTTNCTLSTLTVSPVKFAILDLLAHTSSKDTWKKFILKLDKWPARGWPFKVQVCWNSLNLQSQEEVLGCNEKLS